MTKKKSLISLLLAFCLIIPAMFMFTACGSGNKLTNDSGFEIVGGGFEKGSVLNTNKVENTAETASEIYNKLEAFGVEVTDKAKAIIYDIFVSKDDKKVQPDGKVTLNVKIAENAGGYKVYHIKDDNTVEELSATYKDGILTFETSSFSYYVFVATEAINPIQSAPATAGTKAEWDSAIAYYAGQTKVQVKSRCANDDDPPQSGALIKIYQYDGTAYSEDGYFENELSSQLYKGKIFYLVKEGDKYYKIEWQEIGGENNFKLIKSEYGAEDSYKWAIENEIYGLLDDYNFEDFTYSTAEKTYTKNESDKTIKVAFEYKNDAINKIKITETETSREVTTEITFEDIDIDVPAEEPAE